MGVGHGVGHVRQDSNNVGDRQPARPDQPVPQSIAFDKRHDEVEEVGGFARVEQGYDMGMLQPGHGGDLPEEPLRGERRREFRTQHLDGDVTAMLEVLRQVHRGPATAPYFVEQAIAVGERR